MQQDIIEAALSMLGSIEFFTLSFDGRMQSILKFFEECRVAEDRYKKLLDLRNIPAELKKEDCSPSTLVHGCQSEMHLYIELSEGLIRMKVHSESLISLGLAALLFLLFDDLPASAPFTYPLEPLIQGLGLPQILTPGRSNGFLSMVTHLKKEIVFLLAKEPSLK